MPTLAEIAGAGGKVPDRASTAFPLCRRCWARRSKQKQHESLYWAFYERGGAQALRMGKWKAVEQPLRTPLQLFDLEKDLGETTDVAAKNPEIAAKMKKLMEASYMPSPKWKFPAAKKEPRTK